MHSTALLFLALAALACDPSATLQEGTVDATSPRGDAFADLTPAKICDDWPADEPYYCFPVHCSLQTLDSIDAVFLSPEASACFEAKLKACYATPEFWTPKESFVMGMRKGRLVVRFNEDVAARIVELLIAAYELQHEPYSSSDHAYWVDVPLGSELGWACVFAAQPEVSWVSNDAVAIGHPD